MCVSVRMRVGVCECVCVCVCVCERAYVLGSVSRGCLHAIESSHYAFFHHVVIMYQHLLLYFRVVFGFWFVFVLILFILFIDLLNDLHYTRSVKYPSDVSLNNLCQLKL